MKPDLKAIRADFDRWEREQAFATIAFHARALLDYAERLERFKRASVEVPPPGHSPFVCDGGMRSGAACVCGYQEWEDSLAALDAGKEG